MPIDYATICDHPDKLKALTTLTRVEFEHRLPFFEAAYAAQRPATQTQAGQVRQRAVGGGRSARLRTGTAKLLFILRYAKTYPTQMVLGMEYGLCQGQISTWVKTLMPGLQTARHAAEYAPAREVANSWLLLMRLAFRVGVVTADCASFMSISQSVSYSGPLYYFQ